MNGDCLPAGTRAGGRLTDMAAKKKSVSKRSKSKAAARKKAKSTTRKLARNKPAPRIKKPRKSAVASRARGSSGRAFSKSKPNAQSGMESGDLQGLSRREDVDSQSVEELVEEGNTFEAGAVAGVEKADDAEGREVHTHEVPEDDVPEEYLDKD